MCRFPAAIITRGLRVPLKGAKTELQNPRSRSLDRKSTFEILRVLNAEDARVASAVRKQLPKIARAVDAIVKAFSAGGRLIYVGAGTSGRLAVLDSAECPPTFGVSPGTVQAVIAGGTRALHSAAEDAEDSASNGAEDLHRLKISRRDVMVGISASGTTPYVLGALHFAKRRHALTVALTSNPHSPLARESAIAIAPDTGPEAITGSTRLKAGTAQKMVLNLLSTAAMVRAGRVYGNSMIHVALTNNKLRQRGAQILEAAANVDASTAQHALRQSAHNLPAALVMLKAGVNLRDAQRALASAQGNVRKALKLASGMHVSTRTKIKKRQAGRVEANG
jgi:N-acetylmuramic acid 6-phosphate etherase